MGPLFVLFLCVVSSHGLKHQRSEALLQGEPVIDQVKPECNIERDVEYDGKAISTVNTNSVYECCTKCQQNEKCNIFTYVHAGPKKRQCTLKTIGNPMQPKKLKAGENAFHSGAVHTHVECSSFSDNDFGPFPTKCLQYAFKKAGCNETGRLYPKDNYSRKGFLNQKGWDAVRAFMVDANQLDLVRRTPKYVGACKKNNNPPILVLPQEGPVPAPLSFGQAQAACDAAGRRLCNIGDVKRIGVVGLAVGTGWTLSLVSGDDKCAAGTHGTYFTHESRSAQPGGCRPDNEEHVAYCCPRMNKGTVQGMPLRVYPERPDLKDFLYTFSQARDKCMSQNMRLCPVATLREAVTAGVQGFSGWTATETCKKGGVAAYRIDGDGFKDLGCQPRSSKFSAYCCSNVVPQSDAVTFAAAKTACTKVGQGFRLCTMEETAAGARAGAVGYHGWTAGLANCKPGQHETYIAAPNVPGKEGGCSDDDQKRTAYCCAPRSRVNLEGSPVVALPEFNALSSPFTYDEARKACTNKGMKLCKYTDAEAATKVGLVSGWGWTADHQDVGTKQTCTPGEHLTWKSDGRSYSTGGCEKNSVKHSAICCAGVRVFPHPASGIFPFEQAKLACSEKGYRMCSLREAEAASAMGVIAGEGWVKDNDDCGSSRHKTYISTEDVSQKGACQSDFNKKSVWCCQKQSEVLLDDGVKVVTLPGKPSLHPFSYEAAQTACSQLGKGVEICTIKQAHEAGEKGLIGGEGWTSSTEQCGGGQHRTLNTDGGVIKALQKPTGMDCYRGGEQKNAYCCVPSQTKAASAAAKLNGTVSDTNTAAGPAKNLTNVEKVLKQFPHKSSLTSKDKRIPTRVTHYNGDRPVKWDYPKVKEKTARGPLGKLKYGAPVDGITTVKHGTIADPNDKTKEHINYFQSDVVYNTEGGISRVPNKLISYEQRASRVRNLVHPKVEDPLSIFTTLQPNDFKN